MKFKYKENYSDNISQSSSYFGGDNNWEGTKKEASEVLVMFCILIWVGTT